MKEIFVRGSNIISPLGFNTNDNFALIRSGESGVMCHSNKQIHENDLWASLFSDRQLEEIKSTIRNPNDFSKFETLMIASATDALINSSIDAASAKTIFICSTTKGNISLLGTDAQEVNSLKLFNSAKKVSDYFRNPNDPVVISTACISGIAAIIYAERVLRAGYYDNAVVIGADMIGAFIYSGFHSFQALSPGLCKPFSVDRDGINLGEAAATMILSAMPDGSKSEDLILVGSGSMSNDANHISGPSRTGEELGLAIKKAIKASRIKNSDLGYLSAHGTATIYNDEMEAKAIHFAGLSEVPLNSLKGYFGHTLGAAGLLESIVSIESMKKGLILASAGFSVGGMSPYVNVCHDLIQKEYNHCLKMASGFGGCNAAIIYSKN